MWYLVLSRRVASPEQTQQSHSAHMEWLLEQHRAGQVLFSGPTSDRSYGIYVLRAASKAEAEALAAQDPQHLDGNREMTVLRVAGPARDADGRPVDRGAGSPLPVEPRSEAADSPAHLERADSGQRTLCEGAVEETGLARGKCRSPT